MKNYYPIPSLQGVIKDYHARMIPDDKCSDVLNVMFKQGRVTSRWGYAQFGNQLESAVTAISYYERLRTRQNDLVAFTSSDSYKFNKRNGTWDYITRSYNTGTVSSTTGTVTGSGFSVLFGISLLYIKFGSADINYPGTWYRITPTSDTTLTAYEGVTLPVNTDVAFVVRICWQGGEEDIHSIAYPYYDDGAEWGDKILIVSNGVDRPQWWNGSGCLQEMSRNLTVTGNTTNANDVINNLTSTANLAMGDTIIGTGIPANTYVLTILSATSIQISAPATATNPGVSLSIIGVKPNPAKSVSFFGSVGYEHTILANTKDLQHENQQTLEYSRAGNPFMWEGNYNDLMNTNDPILGVIPFETALAVYKKNNISLMQPELNPTDSVFFSIAENVKRNVGTCSIRTVINLGNYHIFLGWDNIYKFDGITVTGIGTEIIQYLISNMNRDKMSNAFAMHIDEESLYCLFVPIGTGQVFPNYCFAYNYKEMHWTIWQMANEISSYGFFVKDYSPTYADLIVFATGDMTINSSTITDINTINIQVGMSVYDFEADHETEYPGNYLPVPVADGSVNVAKVGYVGADYITLIDKTGNAITSTATGSNVPLKIGWAYEDLHQRYRDMIILANYNSYLLGDTDGNVYEYAPTFYDDNGTAIPALVETSDYEINDPKHVFRLLETTLGFIRQTNGYISIRASVDFGAQWSEWQYIPMNTDGISGGMDYTEYIVNWILRGTQVRFQISNSYNNEYYNPFEIESMLIGWTGKEGTKK